MGLSGFFFCLQSEFLFVFDLFLFYFLVEVAPVAAGDDELVDLELRMNALALSKRSALSGSFVANQMQDRQFPFCHCMPFKRFCSSDSVPDMIETQGMNFVKTT